MRRKRRLALAIANLLLLAAPSEAAIKTYFISKNAEFTFLNIGPIQAPGATTGTVVINDSGNGVPTLTSLDIKVKWNSPPLTGPTIDAATGVAGSSVAIQFADRFGPVPNHVGFGSTTTAINFGTLTGWTQTGHLSCVTTCPTTCVSSACVAAFGFEGSGPPPALTASSYNLDPWTFTSGGTALVFGPIAGQTFWFIPGSVKFAGTVRLGGGIVTIPVLGLWGGGALALGLIGLGAQRLRPSR